MAEVHFGMTEAMYQEFDKILTRYGYTKITAAKFSGWNQKIYYTAVWMKSMSKSEGGVANSSFDRLKEMQMLEPSGGTPNKATGTVTKPTIPVGSETATGTAEKFRDKATCTNQKLWEVLLPLSLKNVVVWIDYRATQKSLSAENPNYKQLGIKEFLAENAPEIYKELKIRLDRRCSPSSTSRLSRGK